VPHRIRLGAPLLVVALAACGGACKSPAPATTRFSVTDVPLCIASPAYSGSAHVETACRRYMWRPSADAVTSAPVATVDWRTLVAFATLAWVDWFNTRRLLEPIGYMSPSRLKRRIISSRPRRRHSL